MAQRRTDLAVEAHQLWREGAQDAASLPGVRSEEEDRDGFPVTTVTISSPAAAQALGKPEGTYVTIELDGLLRREEGAFRRAVEAVAAELRPLLLCRTPKGCEKLMTVRECVESGADYVHLVADDLDELLAAELGGRTG